MICNENSNLVRNLPREMKLLIIGPEEVLGSPEEGDVPT